MEIRATSRPLAVMAGLTATVPAFAQSPSGGWNHPGMMWNGGWFMGPLMMLLFLVIVVAVVVLAVRWLGGDVGTDSQRPSSSARKILEERFSRGEIDEEEFRKRKQALDE
ncbi:MAG: SHOCT domain-containing protein [Halofilum sp. (in: g-proteobacteria)]